MDVQTAKANIGKPFLWMGLSRWDIIKEVDEKTGYIVGEFSEAPIEECRLKQAQPEQLKKKNINSNDELAALPTATGLGF